MLEIRRLTSPDADLLARLITGYSSSARYEVTKIETPDLTRIELRLISLAAPFTKVYPPLDPESLRRYLELVARGHAFGAFVDGECVALALAEPQAWNGALTIHEFHIAPAHHRQGVGRALMSAVEAAAREAGLRCLAVETQTTNVPAIQFYHALGFTLDGLDLSLYSNSDRERGEVALFMKKYLT